MMQVSLVVSTYGRYDELGLLFKSLITQDCGVDAFEVIVIDQNDVIDLSPLVKEYVNRFKLIHFKTADKGLSKAKNKGMELANAPIVTFPDDDCVFYDDTISTAIDFLNSNPDIQVVYGSVYDRVNDKNVMRNWSKKPVGLNMFNFSLKYSAITCFARTKIKFDENLGAGCKIASGEELDYVIRAIKECEVYYFPSIQVWHPELNVETMSAEKVRNYAYGYGYTMRKNFSFSVLIVFLLSFFYRMTILLKEAFAEGKKKNFLAVKGRLEGFFQLDC